MLVAPDGNSQPVAVTRRPRRPAVRQRAPAERLPPTTPGLWELQVFASGDGLQRDARTAFAVAQPTARFKGDHAFNAQLLRVALAGRSRFARTLRGARDAVRVRPGPRVATRWRRRTPRPGSNRGDGMLVLDFDRQHLPAGYGAPFEVRQLELHDQTRMAPLEIRERGARF